MKHDLRSNDMQQYQQGQQTPFNGNGRSQLTVVKNPGVMTRRGFNLLTSGLILIGFLILAICSSIACSPSFMMSVLEHGTAIVVITLICSILGIILIGVAGRKHSTGLAFFGYALVVLTLGFSTGLILPQYDIPAITGAFIGTAVIALVFGILGILFPSFFEKASRVCFGLLIAYIVIAIIAMFTHFQLFDWLDYILLLIFGIFIGRDYYVTTQAAPTVYNSISCATSLYLDLINLFTTLLDIMGRSDN